MEYLLLFLKLKKKRFFHYKKWLIHWPYSYRETQKKNWKTIWTEPCQRAHRCIRDRNEKNVKSYFERLHMTKGGILIHAGKPFWSPGCISVNLQGFNHTSRSPPSLLFIRNSWLPTLKWIRLMERDRWRVCVCERERDGEIYVFCSFNPNRTGYSWIWKMSYSFVGFRTH